MLRIILTGWILRPGFMCAVALLLCCCNGESEKPPAPPAQEEIPNDIFEVVEEPPDSIFRAIKETKLRLAVYGDHTDTLTFELDVISSQPLDVTLAPGYIARCAEFGVSHDKLIVESLSWSFKPGEKAVRTVRTRSASHAPRPAEGRKVRFELEKLGSNESLAQVAAYLIENPDTREKMAQMAVWASAEKMSFAELRGLRATGSGEPFITGEEYKESMDLLRKIGFRVENLRFNLDIEDAVVNYTKKIRNTDKAAALEAIEFFGWFCKTPRAADILVEVMEEEDDPELREKAVDALAGCGLDSVRETLLLTLELDPVRAVRRAGAFSLLALGEMGAVPLAIMFLGDRDATGSVLEDACRKLGELTGVESEGWSAKEWELWWLTKGGWGWLESRGTDVERARKVMDAQHRFYNDPGAEAASVVESEDSQVVLGWLRKLHTAEGREQLTDSAVFEKVITLGMGTSNAAVALNISWILRDTKDPARLQMGRKVLLQMLSRSGNRAAYRDIISVLAEWKAREAIEPLLYLLDDNQYGEFAAEALKKITGKKAPSDSREEWQKLLARHGGSVKADFLKRLKEKDGEKLTQALSDLGSSRYQKLWSDPEIYMALLKTSGNITTWEQVNAFLQIITAGRGNQQTQRTLRKMVEEIDSYQVKKRLIEALSRHFPNGDSVEFMLELLDREDRRMKAAARAALYEITGAESPKRLRSKRDWLEYFSEHPAARWGRRE